MRSNEILGSREHSTLDSHPEVKSNTGFYEDCTAYKTRIYSKHGAPHLFKYTVATNHTVLRRMECTSILTR